MRRDSFSVLFLLKAKQMKNGEMPVSIGVTMNGQRAEARVRKSIDPKLWSQAKECSRARDLKSQDLNNYLEVARMKLHQIFYALEEDGKPITAKLILQFFGQDEDNRRTLLGTFKEHNENCRKLIEIDCVKITVNRFDLCRRYLEEFIQKEYLLDDLMLKDLNDEFVRKFEIFLKIEKNNQQNTVIRYMKSIKTVIHWAIANEWMTRNPFAGIKFQEKEVVKEVLTKEELQIMMQKDFAIPRLELVRDVFIFSVFTRLAFVDVSQLKPEHIVRDAKGKLWIRNIARKQRISVISLSWKFPKYFWINTKTTQSATRKDYAYPYPSIRR